MLGLIPISMKGIKEAPLVKSFAAAAAAAETEDDPREDEPIEPLTLFKGWLPVDDQVNDVDSDSLRMALEVFIRETIEETESYVAHRGTSVGRKYVGRAFKGLSDSERDEVMSASKERDIPSDASISLELSKDIQALKARIRTRVRNRIVTAEGKKKRRRKRRTWDIGGPISTGPGNPGFDSSGGGLG